MEFLVQVLVLVLVYKVQYQVAPSRAGWAVLKGLEETLYSIQKVQVGFNVQVIEMQIDKYEICSQDPRKPVS